MPTVVRLAPPAIVTGPAATPSLHGLIASAQVVNEADDRWTMGLTWAPEFSGGVSVYAPDCTTNLELSVSLTNPACVEHQPVMLEVGIERSTWGFKSQDYEGLATRVLEAGATKALEAEFWQTAVLGNQSLAVSGANVAGLNLSPRRALAALEAKIASWATGGRGMIHAPVELASLWAYDGYLIIEDGNRLVTKSKGNIVVAGAGYLGTGPVGHANYTPGAGKAWAFASGMVQVRQSGVIVTPDTLAEATNRSTNKVSYRASRYAAANFDPACGPSAVLVDLGS